MSSVFITGAAGFVGTNLTEALLTRNHTVHGIDNLSQGDAKNLAENRKNTHFSFQQADVRDISLQNLPLDIATIVHLAAFKIPKCGTAKDALEVNSLGTLNMLELARKKDALFVFSSTSDVYGKGSNSPFSENDDLVLGSPTVQRWAYATSKIFDEHLIRTYNKEYGLKFVILRYFNSFGPKNSTTYLGGPISLFIANALAGKPIEIHGDGSQKRCFCYVSDTIHGTVLAIEKNNAWNETYNIGNDKTERSIKEIAELVVEITGKKIPFQFTPHEKLFGKFEEVSRRVPNLSKARKKLGFEPKLTLEEGIRLTYEWQKNL